MIFKVKELTNILNSIASFTAGDKNVPGVMFDSTGDDIKVCYSDGRKHLVRTTSATKSEGEADGKFVVDFSQIVTAMGNFQSSGVISINEIELAFGEKAVRISADSTVKLGVDADGNDVTRVGAHKEVSLPFKVAGSDMKSAVLIRADYEAIFAQVMNDDGVDTRDTWDIEKLSKLMTRLSVEPNKIAYFSAPWALGFVNNQAYVTSLPITDAFTDSFQLPTAVAKSIAVILGKIKNETDATEVMVKNHENRYITICTEDGSFGLWVEAAKGNKIHIENNKRYQSLGFDKYQVTFRRDLLADMIKSAAVFSAVDKLVLKFEIEESEDGEKMVLVIKSSSSTTSSGIDSRLYVEDIQEIKEEGAKSLVDEEFPIAIKVMNEMLSLLTSEFITFDINIDESNTKTLRLGELNLEKLQAENKKAREKEGLPEITPESVQDGTAVPTPVEAKMAYRKNVLDAIQYTTLARS